MADKELKDNVGAADGETAEKEKTVKVPLKTLTQMQESMQEMERGREEDRLKIAGLEEAFSKGASTEGEEKLREKKNFEPKFRTVRIRKFPIAGGPETGYVVGWTNKGAYQIIDRSGISPQTVDALDVIFLGQEKTPDGKIKAEQIRLLDLLNRGVQVHCKVLETKREEKQIPTGEEIDISVFDPQHGLISTGEKIDGFVVKSNIQYKIQIPGVVEPVWIDATFCN